MNGVLDRVSEFQTFSGGREVASGWMEGCRHGGCWRAVDIALTGKARETNDSGGSERERERGRKDEKEKERGMGEEGRGRSSFL